VFKKFEETSQFESRVGNDTRVLNGILGKKKQIWKPYPKPGYCEVGRYKM
jgi:hypothetical protein